MAIQDFNSDTSRGLSAADPRLTRRAPFPARAEYRGEPNPEHGGDLQRLAQSAREELTSGRLLAEDRRTVARCPACGEAVLAGEDYVRSRGEVYHARCARSDDDGDGDARRR